jgi:tetratricopeptide (TPR) repeat protein
MFIVGAIVSGLSAVLEWHPEGAGATGEQWQFSLVERSLIAGRALWFYLFTLLCPTNLIFIYPRWTIDLTIWYHYLFPTAALVSMVVLGRLHKRIGGAPLAATLFFTGTLLPTLGFLNFYFMCFSFVADHFLYLASIGPIALVGSLLWRTNSFVEKHGPKFSFLYVPLRNFSMHFLFTSLILAGLSTLTWRQAHLYANAETLWSYTIRQNPTSGWAYNNLAAVFSDRKEFSRALPYFEKAVALNPNEPFLHSNLALTFFRTGDFTRALEHGFLSVSLGPRTALSALYADRLGQILWHKGDLVQAGHYFHDAEQQQFANADIYYHLGILTLLEVPLLDLGGPQEGVVRLEKSLQLDLRRAMAAPTLAWVLATFPDPAIRDSRRAVAMAEEVCVRKSFHDADAIDTLGAAYAAAGRFAEAIRITQVAVKMANAEGRREFADRIRARLKLYQVGKPFYDTIKEKITF